MAQFPKRGRGKVNRRSRLVGRAFGTGLALLLLPGVVMVGAAVLAQGPGAAPPADALPKKTYTNKSMLRLPLRIDESARSAVREVRLYVKMGVGDWSCAAVAPPMQSHFAYQAPRDGEYWFSVVTVDQSGQANPPDVGRELPNLIVVVDTQMPDVEVRPLPLASGEVFLQAGIPRRRPELAAFGTVPGHAVHLPRPGSRRAHRPSASNRRRSC